MKDIAISLADLSDQDWADVCAIAQEGGIDPASVTLATIEAGQAPLPVLAALIYVTLREDSPRITPARCVRLAAGAMGVADA